MRVVSLLLSFLLLSSSAYAEANGEKPVSLNKFGEALKTLVSAYYPSAQFVIEADKIHFEFEPRMFMIHFPTMDGEWQDAAETKGPRKHGIVADILLYPGQYEGKAMLIRQADAPVGGQVYDEFYFKRLVIVAESPAHHCYVHATLLYPGNASKEFVAAFAKLVNDWISYDESALAIDKTNPLIEKAAAQAKASDEYKLLMQKISVDQEKDIFNEKRPANKVEVHTNPTVVLFEHNGLPYDGCWYKIEVPMDQYGEAQGVQTDGPRCGLQ